MKTNIITPSEVVAVAFSDGAYLPPEVIAEEDNDIGCGFVMNDYIMQLEV